MGGTFQERVRWGDQELPSPEHCYCTRPFCDHLASRTRQSTGPLHTAKACPARSPLMGWATVTGFTVTVWRTEHPQACHGWSCHASTPEVRVDPFVVGHPPSGPFRGTSPGMGSTATSPRHRIRRRGPQRWFLRRGRSRHFRHRARRRPGAEFRSSVNKRRATAAIRSVRTRGCARRQPWAGGAW